MESKLLTFDEYQRSGGASGLDGRSNYIGNHERDDWLVVVGQNRDSDILTQSNFAMALEELGGEQEDLVEVHRFGHWACGWFELIMVRPGPFEVVATAEDIKARLEDYPILDESDFSEREMEDWYENWESWGRLEFVDDIANAFDLPDKAKDVLSECADALDDYCRNHSDSCDSDHMGADIIDMVHRMDVDDLASIVGSKLSELKQTALIKACKQGLDLFDSSLRWRWDEQIPFPWWEYVGG